MTAIVDTITDLAVAGLQEKIPGEFQYTGDFDLGSISIPNFRVIEAAKRLQVKVSGYDRKPENQEKSRTNVMQIHKIGVGIVKLMEHENNLPAEAEMREMKRLAELIERWLWKGITGYLAIDVQSPLYDLEKAKSGIFLTVINASYKVSFAT